MSKTRQNTKYLTILSLLGSALLTVSGCLDHPLKPTELEREVEKKDVVQLNVNKDVDILFVMDNSGSMGEEQAILANNFGSFIDVLEHPDVRANYRIGVTTSDNGNPRCSGTTPEAGALVYSSCRDRLGAFTNQAGSTNVSAIACEDICDLDSDDLGIDGSDPSQRPWLESVDGASNLPEGVTTTEAFQCIGPQGINGCGFESQLESMNKALIRFDTQSDDAYGFMRDRALLAVVHVTDEADCSYNSDWATIFQDSGNKVFWNSPSDNFPTSAVCWNAGTACTSDGNGGYDCVATDYDVNGNPIPEGGSSADEDAVLHPVARYIDRVQGIENDKKELVPGQEVIVGLIGGVGDSGQPSYADTADATFMADFGIGPGCSAPVPGATACMTDADCVGIGTQACGTEGYCMETQTAIPPVRLAEFTDHFTDENMFSVCNPDYAPALEKIAKAIEDQLKPACYTNCVQDNDLVTPSFVDPLCRVTETVGTAERDLEECLRADGGKGDYVPNPDTGGFTMPADDVNECYAFAVDTAMSTASALDDMSNYCSDQGFNLEFKFERRPGFSAPPGSTISASCVLSDIPQLDCPELG
jgi:hypothetical protein